MMEIEKVEEIIRERIKELNAADASACDKRWDMSLHEEVRKIWREQSNSITMARQELEAILQKMGLPRFKETPTI